MPRIFDEFKEILMKFGIKYRVSATIHNLSAGTELVVGGIIKGLAEDFKAPGNWYVEIDDEVDVVFIYLYKQVFDHFKSEIKVGRPVAVKGILAERKGARDAKIKIVIATSLEFPEEGEVPDGHESSIGE